MHIVFLRLTGDTSKAPEFMAAHKAWIDKGIADGVFLIVGSLKPQGGGAIIVHGEERDALERRLAADPFVQERIATADIQEVEPARTDSRLSFLTSNEEEQ